MINAMKNVYAFVKFLNFLTKLSKGYRLLEIDGKLKYDKYALINGSQESCKLFSF